MTKIKYWEKIRVFFKFIPDIFTFSICDKRTGGANDVHVSGNLK